MVVLIIHDPRHLMPLKSTVLVRMLRLLDILDVLTRLLSLSDSLLTLRRVLDRSRKHSIPLLVHN